MIAGEKCQMRETSSQSRNSLIILKCFSPITAFISCNNPATPILSLSLIPGCGFGGRAQSYSRAYHFASDDARSVPYLLFLSQGFPLTSQPARSFLLCLQQECERQGKLMGERRQHACSR